MLALQKMQHVDFSSPKELDLRHASAYAHELPRTLTCRRIQPPMPRSASTSTVILLGTWQAMRRYLISMRPSSIGAILLKVSACEACRHYNLLSSWQELQCLLIPVRLSPASCHSMYSQGGTSQILCCRCLSAFAFETYT